MINVLFLSRSTLFSQPGGDTVQIEQTAKFLKAIGCHVEIGLSGSFINFGQFDLIHFFNLIRPADASAALQSGVPIVISSIYHDYSEYDGKHRGGMAKFLYSIFGKFGLEYLKTIGRWLNGSDRFPGLPYLWLGQRKSMKILLKRAHYLIATSNQEIELIETDLGKLPPSKKISLGSEHMPETTPNAERKGVLCAARIEGPKNQLKLIRALQNTGIELNLTGNTATNQSEYFRQCKLEAGKNVHFHGRVSSDKLTKLYQKSKVHALISYYETTGLSTLEALKMGCQVVITDRGAQKEIFADHAFYCDPDNIESIKLAIDKALLNDAEHTEWVKDNFSWAKAAHEILDIYQTIMDKTKS